jgi:hypothetical protein
MATELRKGRTLDGVALALRALAIYAGNAKAAARALTEDGFEISPRTLSRWRDRHYELWWEIRRREEAVAAEASDERAIAIGLKRLFGREPTDEEIMAMAREGVVRWAASRTTSQ